MNSTLANKTDCYSDEVIEKKLYQVNMVSYTIDYDIKLNEINDPFKPFLKSEILFLTSSMYKIFVRELSEKRLKTDNSLLFSSYNEKNIYKFTQRREEIDLKKDNANFPGSFSQINFVANTNTEIIQRNYTKLFQVISEIGGFLNGIIFIAYLVLYMYSNNLILWNCIGVLISTKDIKDSIGLNEDKSHKHREIINSRIFARSNLNGSNVNNIINQENANIIPSSQLNIINNNNHLR
jgi:hypothetical protein